MRWMFSMLEMLCVNKITGRQAWRCQETQERGVKKPRKSARVVYSVTDGFRKKGYNITKFIQDLILHFWVTKNNVKTKKISNQPCLHNLIITTCLQCVHTVLIHFWLLKIDLNPYLVQKWNTHIFKLLKLVFIPSYQLLVTASARPAGKWARTSAAINSIPVQLNNSNVLNLIFKFFFAVFIWKYL